MIQFGKQTFGDMGAFLDIAGGASSANVFASLPNPWGIDVIVTRAVLRVTTKSTAASTLDIGPAADATTSNDTLMDGLDVGTATGLFTNSNDTDNGTNGLLQAVWAKDGFITIKEASGNVDGLVARLVVHCAPA
jgi:hypothetical protein